MLSGLPDWLVAALVCPRDREPLIGGAGGLRCGRGHRYPVVDGIPVLLVDDAEQTHWVATESLELAHAGAQPADDEGAEGIDAYVQDIIGATNGIMYEPLVNRLREYPIPDLRMPGAPGATLLDVGCNWGRWTIAARRAGFKAVGIDPSLQAVRAARRVARQLRVDAAYLVADGRYLPFAAGTFDRVYSYSVLQHLAKADACAALGEVRRVLRPGGEALIQMANALGVRSAYNQARRRFARPTAFQVRYWTPGELQAAFEREIGPARVSVDGFFSLNTQAADLRLLPPRYRAVVLASEALRRASALVPGLWRVADSLFVTARVPEPPAAPRPHADRESPRAPRRGDTYVEEHAR